MKYKLHIQDSLLQKHKKLQLLAIFPQTIIKCKKKKSHKLQIAEVCKKPADVLRIHSLAYLCSTMGTLDFCD
jgi:hypothetical protein